MRRRNNPAAPSEASMIDHCDRCPAEVPLLAPADLPTATIDREWLTIRVAGLGCADVRRLVAPEWVTSPGATGQVRARRVMRPLLRRVDDGTDGGAMYAAAAGLEPLVTELLLRGDARVVVRGPGPERLPEPDYGRINDRRRIDVAVLAAIREERGLVVR